MPRLNSDQWAAMRMEWEGDPLMTIIALAAKYGINKSQISRVARRDSWVKTGQIATINENAQLRADAQIRDLNATDLVSRIESEELRAAILLRLRREWEEIEGFRQSALIAMRNAHDSGDKTEWNIAKTAADTALANIRALAAKQDSERRAWGLDTKTEEDVIITNPRGARAANNTA